MLLMPGMRGVRRRVNVVNVPIGGPWAGCGDYSRFTVGQLLPLRLMS